MIRCIMEISSWSNIRKTIRRHIYLKCNVSRNYGRMKGRTEYFILLICSQKCFFLKKCSDSLLIVCTKGENIGAVALIFCLLPYAYNELTFWHLLNTWLITVGRNKMMNIITSVGFEQKIIWFAKRYISSIFTIGLNIQEIFQGISSGDL